MLSGDEGSLRMYEVLIIKHREASAAKHLRSKERASTAPAKVNACLFTIFLVGSAFRPCSSSSPTSPPAILRPLGISRVATTNPTWHTGDGAIWSRPRLAIRPAVGTRAASVVLFNERIWANIWLPGGGAATPCRPARVLPLLFKPGGIKGGPWISKVTKP